MIKALVGQGPNGRPAVLLGLAHENVARLFAEEPIVVDTAAPPPAGLGLDGGITVIIIAGETEQSMVDKLRAAGVEIGTVIGDQAS